MRRLFVLLLVFIIPLQLVDETFDDIAVSNPIQLQIWLDGDQHAPINVRDAVAMSDQEAKDASAQIPHADLSDLAVRWPSLVGCAERFRLSVFSTLPSLPLRVFPLLEPPRV